MKRERGKKSEEEMEGENEKEEEDMKVWAGKGQLREGAREMMKGVRENKINDVDQQTVVNDG